MAARRGKSQARRNQSNGLPGWAWLVIGIALTLLAVLLVPRYLKSDNGDGFFRPKPNPDALPAAVSGEGEAIAPDTAPAGDTKPETDKPKPRRRRARRNRPPPQPPHPRPMPPRCPRRLARHPQPPHPRRLPPSPIPPRPPTKPATSCRPARSAPPATRNR